MNEDTRNVTDEFRGMSVDDIKTSLDRRRQPLQVAVENVTRDFNMGTIVRNANAFNVSTIHVIGRRQWNKRGAMATDKYMHIVYHASVAEFVGSMAGTHIIGIDNIEGSVPLASTTLPRDVVLVFGSESDGLSDDMAAACEQIIAIEQFGSTRSVNVGVASGIAMYAWLQQHTFSTM